MNKLNILITSLVLTTGLVFGQDIDIESELSTARSSYNDGNLEDARFALQQSLVELNNIIAGEILALFPDTMGELPADKKNDVIYGNSGGAGVFVQRLYQTDESKSVEVTIADHSPMYAAVNSFLSNSMLTSMVMNETGQKSIKVNGYKGMLEKTEGDNGEISYNINVPFGDSLLTVETEGVTNEDEALDMAGKIPLDKISELVK